MLKKSSMLALVLAVASLPGCGNDGDDAGQSTPAVSTSDAAVPESTVPATTVPATTTPPTTVPATTTAPETTTPPTTVPATTTPEEAVTLPNNVLVLTDRELSNATLQQRIDEGATNPEARLSGDIDGQPVTIVKLSGKTNHFGRDENLEYIDYRNIAVETIAKIQRYIIFQHDPKALMRRFVKAILLFELFDEVRVEPLRATIGGVGRERLRQSGLLSRHA